MHIKVNALSLASSIADSFPFSVVKSYEASNNHNYINATVTAVIFLSMVAGLVVLYKCLAPRNGVALSKHTHEATNHGDVTLGVGI